MAIRSNMPTKLNRVREKSQNAMANFTLSFVSFPELKLTFLTPVETLRLI